MATTTTTTTTTTTSSLLRIVADFCLSSFESLPKLPLLELGSPFEFKMPQFYIRFQFFSLKEKKIKARPPSTSTRPSRFPPSRAPPAPRAYARPSPGRRDPPHRRPGAPGRNARAAGSSSRSRWPMPTLRPLLSRPSSLPPAPRPGSIPHPLRRRRRRRQLSPSQGLGSSATP